MKKLFLIACLVLLPGCSVFQGPHPKMAEVWPVYRVPGKPALTIPETIKTGESPELDAMIKNLYDTINYSESLKIIVETHNTAAKAHNQQVEQDLGVGR